MSVCCPAWCQHEREGPGSAPAELLQPLLQYKHQELLTLPKVPCGFIFRASCKTSVLMGLVTSVLHAEQIQTTNPQGGVTSRLGLFVV